MEEWVPRFVPYHLDLVQELGPVPGQRALVACVGPGSEALAIARAVGESGSVLATDPNEAMVALCAAQVAAAGLHHVTCKTAAADDCEGGPWDLIVCAFGLWQLPNRDGVLAAWKKSLAPMGKIGILTWGPAEEDDPFERITRCLAHLEPDRPIPSPRILAQRDTLAEMFEAAKLELVRHTVVHHTMSFPSAEAFVEALKETSTFRRVYEDLGEERFLRVAARFYGLTGGPDAPLSWRPAATLALATHPGADVPIPSRRGTAVPPPL